jgi:hypothetical protein
MRSLRKMLRLRRQRREAESQRFMAEIARWVTAASRFDQPNYQPDVEMIEPDDPSLKSDSVKHT